MKATKTKVVPVSKHNTGMRGVFLVAAELSKRGYIVSPTSRSAFGADLLVTTMNCRKAWSVQVKTNARTFNFWLLNQHSKDINSSSHIYVFVNLRKGGDEIEYYIVPNRIVCKKLCIEKGKIYSWYSFSCEDAEPYKDKWKVFG